jgi:hypothetical protein
LITALPPRDAHLQYQLFNVIDVRLTDTGTYQVAKWAYQKSLDSQECEDRGRKSAPARTCTRPTNTLGNSWMRNLHQALDTQELLRESTSL